MRMLPKTNEHSFFGCSQRRHTQPFGKGVEQSECWCCCGLYIIAMVLAAVLLTELSALHLRQMRRRASFELHRQNHLQRNGKKLQGKPGRQSTLPTCTSYACCACLQIKIICYDFEFGLHAACSWSVHIIQQFHSPKRRVDSKTNCSTTLFGTAFPFLWDPGYHTTAWVACWRNLAPKRPATNQKNWTLHAIGQPDLQWKFVHDAGASPCENTCTNQTSTKSSMLSQRLCGNVAPQQAPDLTCQRLEH